MEYCKRVKQVRTCLTDDEHEQLAQEAAKRRMPVAVLLRLVLFGQVPPLADVPAS